eukprot:CAMPEP_0117080864 /NCGR_PEP_ID=MMETSP0472-20121206/57035_1 /TAXON_ID=693140 ORGANISM="Tiarina fusus, Strain LIS" /NCGR_SAMPLE_ID=MMETSP0472 /ASSEMBLY_ACC=CAM_ASM_000603 /LENGTH=663 /DNA_ID=CAMNT_0004808641 /DNA_START=90 /DNA_END=2081 /DNA_ORIENTATION=+
MTVGGRNNERAALSSSAGTTLKSGIMKPWTTYMVEATGDYRREMFLEEHIGGPLYAFQKEIPKLPIPDIQDTIERFLPTALPLVKSAEEKVALKEACEAFPEQAELLQQRLTARRNGEFANSSWLQKWWNEAGYLQVSYFFGFVDDPTVDVVRGSAPNVQRAAAMLFATAEFRKLVVTGQLPCERVGKKKTPLCSTAYKYMFNACRIPRLDHDSYRIYDPSRNTHCIVARKGHFFSMELVDSETGNPLSVYELERMLQQCIAMADAIPSSRPKLGVLTSGNRDDWARDRVALLESGGAAMENALERLQSGAILVNLDDESPVSRQECGELFWTGGLGSGPNRWFDKSIQIMVANNGKAGLIAEHSMMDGMPVINYANYITKMTYARARRMSVVSGPTGSASVEDIFASALGRMDPTMVESLEAKAWKAFHKLITDHTLHAQSFQGYGSAFIKKSGFPPDAYVQMAMQLATYRLFGEQVGTYEATQVRPFLHGRTEVTRSVSTASEAFIKAMGLYPKFDEADPNVAKEKLALLQRATKTHSAYTGKAAKAQGVDRHLLGLAMMVREGEKAPALFSDPAFIRSKRWRSSTSQLSHPRFNLWGYGEVVPDGVGLAYAILPNSCVFNITALRSTGWTDKLSEHLEGALLEMRRVVETRATSSPKSKL